MLDVVKPPVNRFPSNKNMCVRLREMFVFSKFEKYCLYVAGTLAKCSFKEIGDYKICPSIEWNPISTVTNRA